MNPESCANAAITNVKKKGQRSFTSIRKFHFNSEPVKMNLSSAIMRLCHSDHSKKFRVLKRCTTTRPLAAIFHAGRIRATNGSQNSTSMLSRLCLPENPNFKTCFSAPASCTWSLSRLKAAPQQLKIAPSRSGGKTRGFGFGFGHRRLRANAHNKVRQPWTDCICLQASTLIKFRFSTPLHVVLASW